MFCVNDSPQAHNGCSGINNNLTGGCFHNTSSDCLFLTYIWKSVICHRYINLFDSGPDSTEYAVAVDIIINYQCIHCFNIFFIIIIYNINYKTM